MTEQVRAALTGLLIFSGSVWLGGMITVIVLTRVANRVLARAERIEFFRVFGRMYGAVTTVALAVAYGTGAALLWGRPWGGVLIATVVVAAAVVLATAVGVVQARRISRLRAAAVARPDDEQLATGVRRAAVRAAALRGLIGVVSFALLGLGVVLGA